MLVAEMDMHPDAADVAHQLWTAHLTCCGVLHPDFAMCVHSCWRKELRSFSTQNLDVRTAVRVDVLPGAMLTY